MSCCHVNEIGLTHLFGQVVLRSNSLELGYFPKLSSSNFSIRLFYFHYRRWSFVYEKSNSTRYCSSSNRTCMLIKCNAWWNFGSIDSIGLFLLHKTLYITSGTSNVPLFLKNCLCHRHHNLALAQITHTDTVVLCLNRRNRSCTDMQIIHAYNFVQK